MYSSCTLRGLRSPFLLSLTMLPMVENLSPVIKAYSRQASEKESSFRQRGFCPLHCTLELLFLPRLFDALLSCIEWSLALCLVGHLFLRFRIWWHRSAIDLVNRERGLLTSLLLFSVCNFILIQILFLFLWCFERLGLTTL